MDVEYSTIPECDGLYLAAPGDGPYTEGMGRLSAVERMAGVMETLRNVSLVTDLDKLLHLILKASKKTMQAEAASLLLIDYSANELYFHEMRGGSREVKPVRLKMGQGIAGRVAKTGRPMLVNDAKASKVFFAGADQVSGFETRQVLAVPMRVRKTVIGVLEAINTSSPKGFEPEDLELFTAFAGQAAIAIENARLFNLVVYDSLTRIFTRRYFDAWFDSEFARVRRYQRPLCLLVFDIDKFKDVNDVHGHAAGDYVLVQTAQLIKTMTRTSDTLARYGGDEFVLALTETPTDRAPLVADRIRAAVENHVYEFSGASLRATISVGVSGYRNETDLTPKRMLQEADMALYEAKVSRNKVSVFSRASA